MHRIPTLLYLLAFATAFAPIPAMAGGAVGLGGSSAVSGGIEGPWSSSTTGGLTTAPGSLNGADDDSGDASYTVLFPVPETQPSNSTANNTVTVSPGYASGLPYTATAPSISAPSAPVTIPAPMVYYSYRY